MDEYKYHKYKNKYMHLKITNMQNGGKKNTIIHVSGAPGSGKTTLGNKIQNFIDKNPTYGDKVIVKDLDDLFAKYMSTTQEFNSDKYQKYIDNFIGDNKKKIIIFVGLNKEHLTETLYDIQADYKYFIDLPTEINLERHFDREINQWLNWMKNRDKHILFNQLLVNEEEVITDLRKTLSEVLDISQQKKFIMSFDTIYKKQGYIFLDSNTIYKNIIKILKTAIQ